MKGIGLGSLCGIIALGIAGCSSNNPTPATAQYSYTYDFDLPLQPVEPVVYTAAPVPFQALGTTNSIQPVAPGSVPNEVRTSEVGLPAGTSAPTVVPHSGVTVSGQREAPAGAPSPVTRTGDGLPTPGLSIPVENDAPNARQNVTTIVEPSNTGTSLERSTIVVDAPVQATTNKTTIASPPGANPQ